MPVLEFELYLHEDYHIMKKERKKEIGSKKGGKERQEPNFVLVLLHVWL
jgi:hypothetical protein